VTGGIWRRLNKSIQPEIVFDQLASGKKQGQNFFCRRRHVSLATPSWSQILRWLSGHFSKSESLRITIFINSGGYSISLVGPPHGSRDPSKTSHQHITSERAPKDQVILERMARGRRWINGPELVQEFRFPISSS
jgi:hypothetical protein